MISPRFRNRICKASALVTATLILPALAYAQNNQGDNQLAALQAQVNALETQVNALQNELIAAKPVLDLAPFVCVDPNPEDGVIGPNIKFTGANIHIVSGLFATDDHGNPSGLGNLIIGYDEVNPKFPLNPGDRGGSHNLVIGRFNRFKSNAFGGLVAGEDNTIAGEAPTVCGGLFNTAVDLGAVVIGGTNATAFLEQIRPEPLFP
jgi:hypothetical protein